jgi:hypothetical protein
VSLLRLLDQTPWVGDGTDYELSVQIVAAPPGSQLQVTVHDRVRSRSEFARSLEGEGLRRRLSGPSPVLVETLDPDGDGAVALLVPLVPAEGRSVAPIVNPGVYPVVVELLDPNGDPLASLRTYLTRLPAAGTAEGAVPLSVAVVVPLHAPPADLDATAPGPATGPVEATDALAVTLASHPSVPVVLVPTPESLAAADFVDTEAVSGLAAALAGGEVLPGPWVALEEAAWAEADAGALTRLAARGERTLSGLLDTSPAAARLVPSGASLAEVATLVDGGARAVIVAEDDLEPLDTDDFPYTLARPFDLDLSSAASDDDEGDTTDRRVVRAVAADAALQELAATADGDPILAANQVLADLAVIASDEPESARVATLSLPAAAADSPAFLEALLSGLEPPATAAPVVSASTLTAALDTVEPAGADGITANPDDPLVRRLAQEGAVGDVSGLAASLFREAIEIGSYRSVFGPDDPGAARCDDVLATAAAEDLERDARAAALGSIETLIGGRLSGLEGPASQQVRLTDREGRIQLVLTNVTGTPADVTLRLRGDRLVFPDVPDGILPVHLAEESTRVELRVIARSSGDAPLDILLTTPDGRRLLGQSRITVRTTAFSGVGVVLMGAAAAFLAVWWTRTILRERRTARRRHPSHLRRT